MTVTPASFRIDFPEFANVAAYPNSAIIFWVNLGNQLLNPNQWGQSAPGPNNPPVGLFDIGLELYAAHNLVLEAQAQASAAAGGIPGQSQGILSSKSVGPVSASYDTTAGISPGDSHWNLTTYGTRFRTMLKMAGMGAAQVNGHSSGAPIAGTYAGAWVGPSSFLTGQSDT